jgi:seryl-tRNA synthetase
MPELLHPVDATPSAEQLAFVEQALRASFKVHSVRAEGAALVLTHDDTAAADAIQGMTRRYLFISKNINKDLVFHNTPSPRYHDDPQPALEASGSVMPIEPGFYSFQGDFLRVFNALNATVLTMARQLGAIEQEHPAVWPVRLFKAIDYFHEFPHQVILCAPVKDEFATRSLFAKRYGKGQDFTGVAMDDMMDSSSYGLQPAVCDCCYYTLGGGKPQRDAFYTTYNKVFRNERSATNRLDRLTNFSVRDIMFVGSEPFVLEARQRLIELLSRFITALDLHAKIETANDPFFANDSAMKTVFQNAHRLKYELLARIEHLGRDIAVGSVNLHTDFFGKAFDIRLADGSVAHSGCIGVGMERMAYALFCQHGPELARWPAPVRAFLALQA